jgi:hypothetical protein
MGRGARLAALAAIVSLAFGSLAWAHDDDDDYNRRDARQYGYQNGYRDGVRHGRYDRSANVGYNLRSDQWEDASDGYQRGMGSFGRYRKGYRQGYENGYRAGYSSDWGRRNDYDRDDGYYNRFDRDAYGGEGRGNIAYNTGWNDGSAVAQSDVAQGKRYNSKPRGDYDDADHGYRREYGDKHAYKAEYTAGYRAGYDSAFSQSRGRW